VDLSVGSAFAGFNRNLHAALSELPLNFLQEWNGGIVRTLDGKNDFEIGVVLGARAAKILRLILLQSVARVQKAYRRPCGKAPRCWPHRTFPQPHYGSKTEDGIDRTCDLRDEEYIFQNLLNRRVGEVNGHQAASVEKSLNSCWARPIGFDLEGSPHL